MKKALWVVRDKITTAKGIDDLIEDAATRGIFDLVVQVRGRGDAYYRSDLEPRAEVLLEDIDPLDRLIRYGGTAGIRVHAWANVYFVWSHPERALPKDPKHLVNAHPDWLLRPDGVAALDPAGGKDWEGIYTDPANPAATAHTLRYSRTSPAATGSRASTTTTSAIRRSRTRKALPITRT